MITPTVIHFVRHGKVVDHGVYYGRLPGFHLSEEGRCQALAAAEELGRHHIAAIFSSPLERATETAAIIAERHNGLTWQISDLINEVCTPFDGQPISVVKARDWDVYTGNKPPYELPLDVLRRAQQFASEVRRQYVGQQVVATTHGDVIAFLMLWVKGLPITLQQKQDLYREYVAPASVTTCTYRTASECEVPTMEYVAPFKESKPS